MLDGADDIPILKITLSTCTLRLALTVILKHILVLGSLSSFDCSTSSAHLLHHLRYACHLRLVSLLVCQILEFGAFGLLLIVSLRWVVSHVFVFCLLSAVSVVVVGGVVAHLIEV